ncbi:hypothetical protein ZWY2020_033120 [Hordeum vulgare]|nr:hypothetical protein ZWY2020_033120 [Hordeum vulgare]
MSCELSFHGGVELYLLDREGERRGERGKREGRRSRVGGHEGTNLEVAGGRPEQGHGSLEEHGARRMARPEVGMGQPLALAGRWVNTTGNLELD